MNTHPATLPDKSNLEFATGGFILKNTGRLCSWNEIEKIVAYKVDLLTIDDIRLDIDFPEFVVTISEDDPGFELFLKKMKEALPGILENWYEKVVQPPFAANPTIIFNKNYLIE